MVQLRVPNLVRDDGADVLHVAVEVRDEGVVDDDALGAEEASHVGIGVGGLARAVDLEDAAAVDAARLDQRLDAVAHIALGQRCECVEERRDPDRVDDVQEQHKEGREAEAVHPRGGACGRRREGGHRTRAGARGERRGGAERADEQHERRHHQRAHQQLLDDEVLERVAQPAEPRVLVEPEPLLEHEGAVQVDWHAREEVPRRTEQHARARARKFVRRRPAATKHEREGRAVPHGRLQPEVHEAGGEPVQVCDEAKVVLCGRVLLGSGVLRRIHLGHCSSHGLGHALHGEARTAAPANVLLEAVVQERCS
mmetsp:Transcript_30153/g.89651  ORF Transcript_30153/g.89651 Transcript_30153/m.89651 type:complete len:311 (+) Transcript_30153:561-1493(+)